MALVAMISAKGAPGVSTLAVALAAVHPRPAVVADLDPAGGDLALRYRDEQGRPLDPERGLLSLGAAVRHGAADPRPHLQTIAGGLEVLVGIASPEQVTGLGPVWPRVSAVLRATPDRDVFADCGRFTSGSPALPVLVEADAVVIVTRSTLEQLAHLRERVQAVAAVTRAGRRGGPVGVAVIAGARERSVAGDLQRLLDAGGLEAVVLGAVALDPKGAGLLASGRHGGVGRSPLVRSVRSLAPAVARHAEVTAVG